MRRAVPFRLLFVLALLTVPILAPERPQCQPIPVDPVTECADDSVCDTGEICMVGICDPDTMRCEHVPAPDGSACDDHDACTTWDVCVAGQCYGAPIPDDDDNPCTELVCDPERGDFYVPLDGRPCDDGDICTIGDVCRDGLCIPSWVIDCDDGDPCTQDFCDPTVGCVHIMHDPCACDDGDPCTANWVEAGACLAVPIDCDDGDPCTTDSCDPAVGGCVHRPTEDCDGAQPWGCHDAQDNDRDGYVDMDDPDCADVPCCPGAEDCRNGMDDDLDGLVDCADPDCAADPACQ